MDNTIPPPMEFQDYNSEKLVLDENNANLLNITEEPKEKIQENVLNTQMDKSKLQLSSMTPEFLIPPSIDGVASNRTPEHDIQQSQIITPRILNLSPINAEKPLHSIDIAQQSKFSPLTVVKQKLQLSQSGITMATSTPKQKSILNYMRNTENLSGGSCVIISQSSEKPLSKTPPKKPCIACTRLSTEQVFSIRSLCSKQLATYSSVFSSSVTHMIVEVNEENRLKDHTMKYVTAVASRIWVVNFKWIEACLIQGCVVLEVIKHTILEVNNENYLISEH